MMIIPLTGLLEITIRKAKLPSSKTIPRPGYAFMDVNCCTWERTFSNRRQAAGNHLIFFFLHEDSRVDYSNAPKALRPGQYLEIANHTPYQVGYHTQRCRLKV
jgi:hypothetical protein